MPPSPNRPNSTPVCLALALALLTWAAPASAQAPTSSEATACVEREAIAPAHLYGLWQLTLGTAERPAGSGQLIFTRHPEFPGSVRGALALLAPGQRHSAMVAGDVTDQGFQMEESADGTSIDAVWSGEVRPDSCGREIQGWRRVMEGNSAREAEGEQPFVLKKAPNWR
jgi:hypothetical protein